MDDLERQVAAWTDATAAAADVEPVRAEEAIGRAGASGGSSPAPRRGVGARRWGLLAAAAVVVVGALGVAVVARGDGGDREQVRTGDPDAATTAPSPTTSAPTDPDGGPDDRFDPVGSASDAGELLHVGPAGPAPEGLEWTDGQVVLRAASTPAQLEELWRGLRFSEPTTESSQPEVDLDEEVVVSISVGGEVCPRSFEGFAVETGPDGTGGSLTRLQPKLVVPAGADCVAAGPDDAMQYVIAIDWASVGDRFALFVDSSDLAADPTVEPDRAGTTQAISLDRARPDPVVIDVEPTATTVAAGSTLPVTVRASNNSGRPIEITYCGAEFAVGLESEQAQQQVAFNGCLEGSVLRPGTSLFEIRVDTTYLWCTSTPDPGEDDVVCGPDGTIPALPAGEYRTRLYPPGGLGDVTAPPVAVTITDP